MSAWKRLGRTSFVQSAAGGLAAGYLRLVRATTRLTTEPADIDAAVAPRLPVILAMWHGQHFMIHFARPSGVRVSALISRSGDGALNTAILSRLGVEPVRGSGGSSAKSRKRGGAAAFREMVRRLEAGSTVALTADIPKISRIAGPGVAALAQASGRPIFPIAVVSSRRIDFSSWDRASIGLPFARGAIVLGAPIEPPARDADAATLEATRLSVERGLDAAHARAYAMVGARDPGARPPAQDAAP